MESLSVIVSEKANKLVKKFFESSKSKFILKFFSLHLAKIFNHEKYFQFNETISSALIIF